MEDEKGKGENPIKLDWIELMNTNRQLGLNSTGEFWDPKKNVL